MALTPAEVRDQFPIARRFSYLNHAALAPIATPVRATMDVFLNRLSEEPFDHEYWERLKSQVRGRVAELIGVGPESVAFIKNTSSGLGMVAAGLDWQAGDNVVAVDREFPANIYPWMDLRRKQVELRLYKPEAGRIEASKLVALCDARTRVLAVSAVQFWNGFRVDIAAIHHALAKRDTLLVIDGMQAVGALRFDLSTEPVDFLCAGAQKWMLGPIGIGFCWLSARMLELLHPPLVGVESVVRSDEYFAYDLTFKPDARRYEEAAPNYPGILGLGAAVNLLLRAGTREIETEVLRLSDRLRNELPERGYELWLKPGRPSERSGIVSFRHPGIVPEEVLARLKDAGVIISLRQGYLRASPHFYNNDADIDRLLEALPR